MSSPLSSPWNNQINRALESDPLISANQVVTPPPAVVASPPPHTVVEEEGLENGSGSRNVAAGKGPSWNKPSNGHEIGVGPVMGAHSWHALSDVVRASSTKSASLDSLKGIAAEISLQVSASQKFKALLLNLTELNQENAASSFAEITSSSKVEDFFHSVSISL
ncbi:hypothetical protein ACFE04_006255 [Oxalis oulophora]